MNAIPVTVPAQAKSGKPHNSSVVHATQDDRGKIVTSNTQAVILILGPRDTQCVYTDRPQVRDVHQGAHCMSAVVSGRHVVSPVIEARAESELVTK